MLTQLAKWPLNQCVVCVWIFMCACSVWMELKYPCQMKPISSPWDLDECSAFPNDFNISTVDTR